MLIKQTQGICPQEVGKMPHGHFRNLKNYTSTIGSRGEKYNSNMPQSHPAEISLEI